jgi:hypothetical protein
LSILKTGNINTKELLEIFGTKKQKEYYQTKKKLNNTNKNIILNKAGKFCNIEDLGKGKFIIHKVYGMINENNIIPLKKGLYKYFIPLILTKLLNEQDKNYKITLPFLGWARKFDIINDNYSIIKYHQDISSKELSINEDIMFEYFTRIDECIKHYLNECLMKLSDKKTLDIIDFDYVTMVRKSYTETIPNNNSGLDIVCSHVDEVISDDDHKFVIDCEQEARIFAGIEQPKEKFYGVKSQIYKNKYRSLLLQRNISFTYSAYNIFCKNKEGIKDVLEQFKYNDNCDFVKDFNEKFIEYVNNKAKIRQYKEIIKSEDETINAKFLQEHRLLEVYLSEINKLSEITLKKDCENILQKLEIKDTLKTIADEFNINIIRQ